MDNLYVFHGADRKTGVTMIAQSVAEGLANMLLGEDILLVTLNGRRNAQFLKDDVRSIDDYRTKIESGIHIDKSELNRVNNLSNLYVISGIRREREERLYMPETAKKLLADLAPQFGIVIADCGSDLDNGLTIGGLGMAKEIFMVISQNEATIRRYENMKGLYGELGIKFDGIVVNKFSERDPYGEGYIKRRLETGYDNFFKVGMAKLDRQAEMEYRTIMDLREDGFVSDIEQIAYKLIQSSGKSIKNEKRKGRWKGFI